jgi:hypothetical protein
MCETTLRRLTGILLVMVPIASNLLFTLLSVTFEYPDILREPAGYVLQRFDAGGAGLVATWCGFMLTAVLFVPLAILVHRALAVDGREAGEPFYLGLATTFGVVAGVVQFLGLARWPFLVPYFADSYTDPASSAATRESVVIVFEAFNRYAGVAVGEHLGYLFTGLWTVLAALAVRRSLLFGRLGRWFGFLGLGSAVWILAGILEFAGFALAANVVTVAYILWSAWLLALGITLLRRATRSGARRTPDPSSDAHS